MSQIGNALKMYLILQVRSKCKISELAQEVEVDERSIRRYRDDLEQAGIYIDSKRGKDGGYSLYSDNYLLGLNISDSEFNSLQLVQKELKDSMHIASKDISILANKINVVVKEKAISSDGFNNHIINHMKKDTISNIDPKIERKYLMDIHVASLTCNKIKMTYVSLTSGESQRIVHPYATFRYKNNIYFMGYCENREEILHFKICRIKEYTILEEKFKKKEDFDLEKSMENCLGIYRDEELDVKLKIKNQMSEIVKEKIWVENQKIEEIEGGIIFKAKIRGKTELISWILSMGSDAEVLEPEELRQEITDEIFKMKNLYL
jgi:predicted DNA-binding transcriptional regulator YafY